MVKDGSAAQSQGVGRAGLHLEKDPDEWVSGDEPMTSAQASYLKTLSEEVKDSDAFDPKLTKAEASKRIDALKAEVEVARERSH